MADPIKQFKLIVSKFTAIICILLIICGEHICKWKRYVSIWNAQCKELDLKQELSARMKILILKREIGSDHKSTVKWITNPGVSHDSIPYLLPPKRLEIPVLFIRSSNHNRLTESNTGIIAHWMTSRVAAFDEISSVWINMKRCL